MAESKATSDDEVTKLKARIGELEAQLTKHRGDGSSKSRNDDSTTRRAADSWSDATRTARDSSQRLVRGMALAGLEGMRIFGDSISAFADGVFSRNEPKNNDSVRDLTSRLPGDVMGGIADAIDRLADIPSRAADTYSSSWREGEDRDRNRNRDDDRGRDRDTDRSARARERGEGESSAAETNRASRARARASARDREREDDRNS